MKVALVDIDSKIPNLALMKIAAFHKQKGDTVNLVSPEQSWEHDKVYASKIFTWSQVPELPSCAVVGGEDICTSLPPEIDSICPDYSLYGTDYSVGFLTRGCIRRCEWCFVWRREGNIRPAADIEDFLRHDKAVLLDNNVLAHEHGIRQIEKIAQLGIKVDFNQGIDARLIDDTVAKLLAKVKWLEPIRLACDTGEMIPVIQRAVELLRWHNVTPRRYFCYVLCTDDIKGTLERIRFLKGIDVKPFVQPYIPPSGEPANQIQKNVARWANHKADNYNGSVKKKHKLS